jgi:hypothetical protein
VDLVGGQAVAVWTAYLHSHLTDSRIAAQVVSDDLDFLGDAEDTRMAGKLLGGKIQFAKLAFTRVGRARRVCVRRWRRVSVGSRGCGC